MQIDEAKIKPLWGEAQSTGLFQPAGRELKALINRKFSDKEIQMLISWIDKVATAIESRELK